MPKEDSTPMLLFDAHLDLAMNAMEQNRDLRCEIDALRRIEDEHDNHQGGGAVSLPAMRRGGIGLCVATLIARYSGPSNPLPGWASPQQAHAHTRGQLAWYREMEQEGYLTPVTSLQTLRKQLERWAEHEKRPIGYLLSLEGADSLVSPEHLDRLWQDGLRALGPAHYGSGIHACGTGSEEGFTTRGCDLLGCMEEKGMILDTTHLTDRGFDQALDLYGGPIWASHSNCRALVPGQRQLSDRQIAKLIQRQAVIGIALDACMLVPGWVRGKSDPGESKPTLDTVIDHIDHICQIAGDTLHVGIGSDLDGGFGIERCPVELNSIENLAQLPTFLSRRGHDKAAIGNICHGNWLRFLERSLPER